MRLPDCQQRYEPAMGKVLGWQRPIYRGTVAQLPPRTLVPVDRAPCLFGFHAQTDKTAYDRSSAPPVSQEKSPQSPPYVGVEMCQHRLHACADPEEPDPSPQVLVEPLDAGSERVPPCPGSERTDLLGEALAAALRQEHVHVPVSRIAPQTEAEKVPFLRPSDGALHLVHLQPQSAFDETDEARHHTESRPLAADVDVGVVGIPDEAVAAPGEFPIELVQHDVTEQWRKRTPLRGPFLRAHHHSVRHHDLGLEHLADEPEQAAIL